MCPLFKKIRKVIFKKSIILCDKQQEYHTKVEVGVNLVMNGIQKI